MNEKAFNPDPMFRQRKPIGTQPEAVAGLIRFIDALLCLAAAFLGGDASVIGGPAGCLEFIR